MPAFAAFISVVLSTALPVAPPLAPAASGTISVSFLYMPPSQIEPTYHTAIWLEDGAGKIVKTLFVTQELSNSEFKMGDACPDWVRQAHWEKADKSLVDAVTAPTPNVGSGALSFDVSQLGLAPGTYQFKFQVHISDKYNVLHTGSLTVGDAPNQAKLEMLYSPSKPPGGTDFVRDVSVQFTPAK